MACFGVTGCSVKASGLEGLRVLVVRRSALRVMSIFSLQLPSPVGPKPTVEDHVGSIVITTAMV